MISKLQATHCLAIVSACLIVLRGTPGYAQTLGVPNTGNAPPIGPPIQIEDCVAGNDGGALLAESDRRFKVVFTNEGRVPADLIKFRIDFGNQSLAIRDAGKFSPGVTITHVFKRRGGNVFSSPLFAPARLSCTIAAVHFVDGTEWTPNGASEQAAAARPIGNGYLGIQMRQTESGVVISLLFPSGPGRKAGLRQGDLIDTIDEQRITTLADAIQLISASEPGSSLKIGVRRNGELVNVIAVVGRQPTAAP